MKKNLELIIKMLQKTGASDKEILSWLEKPQEKYLSLSVIEFIKINPPRNSKIVLENIKSMLHGEAMGA